ncbi:hypothetical protein IC575_012207 [Cucumis melo]
MLSLLLAFGSSNPWKKLRSLLPFSLILPFIYVLDFVSVPLLFLSNASSPVFFTQSLHFIKHPVFPFQSLFFCIWDFFVLLDRLLRFFLVVNVFAVGCFFNLHRKTKIKRGGDSVKELNRSNKSDRKPTNRGIEALETLPTPRSIPELYKEKEHTLRVFTFEELKIATNGFIRLLRIGEGGFGSVYKGQIRLEGDQGEEIIVAIKRLKSNSSQVREIVAVLIQTQEFQCMNQMT